MKFDTSASVARVMGLKKIDPSKVIATATITEPAMNKLEAAFADYLEHERLAGIILRWDFEPEKLKLADRTYYTPDFRVVRHDGQIWFYEVKGFWRDDARVKIKVAAQMHPYKFLAVTRVRREWKFEEF